MPQLTSVSRRSHCVANGSVAVPGTTTLPFATQWDLLETLVSWGIPVAPHRQWCGTLGEVHAWVHALESTHRATLDFAIDGCVVKVNSLSTQVDLGATDGGRTPRWARARKFAADIFETRLLAVSYTHLTLPTIY